MCQVWKQKVKKTWKETFVFIEGETKTEQKAQHKGGTTACWQMSGGWVGNALEEKLEEGLMVCGGASARHSASSISWRGSDGLFSLN